MDQSYFNQKKDFNIAINYLVTPAEMAGVIAQSFDKDAMDIELYVSGYRYYDESLKEGEYGYTNFRIKRVSYNEYGQLTVYFDIRTLAELLKYFTPNSVALHVKDRKEHGSDYVTVFTAMDQKSLYLYYDFWTEYFAKDSSFAEQTP